MMTVTAAETVPPSDGTEPSPPRGLNGPAAAAAAALASIAA